MKWSAIGSANQIRSAESICNTVLAASKRSMIACCPKRMPFRRPVVPEVKRIYAGSQARNSSSFRSSTGCANGSRNKCTFPLIQPMQPGRFDHEILFFLGQESRDRDQAKARCQDAQSRDQEIGTIGQDQAASFTFPASAFDQLGRHFVGAIDKFPIGYAVAFVGT